MDKEWNESRADELYQIILGLKDLDECRRFFSDLCTISELRAMEQRLEVAKLLSEGMIYSDILERTGASSVTISRVNRALHYGQDGYKQVFARLEQEAAQDA